MKLLLCRACEDVVRVLSEWRGCRCGASKARYIDDVQAQYTGDHAVMLGFQNGGINDALKERAQGSRKREPFMAFVIPESSSACIRV